MSNRIPFLVLVAAALSACSDNPIPSSPLKAVPLSATQLSSQGRVIPGQYIVVFRDAVDNVDSEAHRLGTLHRGVLRMTYRSAIKGMAISMSDADEQQLRTEPNVSFIEPDREIDVATTQTGAGWGIDRIDQRALPLSGSYSYTADGSGVTVYLLDTGINFAHSEFGGRATAGVDIVTPGGTAADCHGHGSGTAAIAGGATYGVAKKVKLVAVRIIDCNGHGANSNALAGVDWITAHRVLPAVANASIQVAFSAALNQGIANSVASGVVYVVAAGNTTNDACTWSPASATSAITVGATDISDRLASFSNFGTCVALLAPGVNVPSATIGSTTANRLWSGTSFASPHVAGLAAQYLQTHATATPAQTRSWIVSNATAGAVTSVPSGTPNLLAFSPQTASGNQAPVARFAVTCPTQQCSFNASTSSDDVRVLSYAWIWGNGKSETHSAATALNSYASQGTYAVTLTVTDGGGLSNSVTKQVVVPTATSNAAPAASFTRSCANPTLPHQCTVIVP